jgi:hypothetical protein
MFDDSIVSSPNPLKRKGRVPLLVCAGFIPARLAKEETGNESSGFRDFWQYREGEKEGPVSAGGDFSGGRARAYREAVAGSDEGLVTEDQRELGQTDR